MRRGKYLVLLDNKVIGSTALDKADVPMGVVFGELKFDDIDLEYDYLKSYCLSNDIEIITDYPADQFLVSGDITGLSVVNPNGLEIKGESTYIEGMNRDGFSVVILGIDFTFFKNEFMEHLNVYDDQFKRRNKGR